MPIYDPAGEPRPDELFLGYPSSMQEQQPLLLEKPSTETPHEPRKFGPWGSCATMCGFVAFAVLVVAAIPTVLNSLSGSSSVLGRSEGCISDPWAGAAALPGNETRFSDPVWQKWQASQLLSAWGLASGRRTFVAVAGAHPGLQLVSRALCPLCGPTAGFYKGYRPLALPQPATNRVST